MSKTETAGRYLSCAFNSVESQGKSIDEENVKAPALDIGDAEIEASLI